MLSLNSCRLALLLALSCLNLAAQQVITVHDDVQLNWSQLQLNFVGSGQGETFAELEQLAWQDGFQRLKQVLPQIYAQHYPRQPATDVSKLAAHIFRNLQLRATVFFSDRRVRVDFSSALANAFGAPPRRPDDARLSRTRNSGLILRAARPFPPRAVYTIRGRSGQLYFEVRMVRKKFFRRGLMGRYFRNASASQLARYVGRNAQELTVREIAPAVLEVDDAAWDRFALGNATLLAKARIVIVFDTGDN